MSKKILHNLFFILIPLFLLNCATTGSKDSKEADTESVTTQTTADAGTETSDVVPSLEEAKKKSSEKPQTAKTDSEKLPAKAEKDERVAQVKEIMKEKISQQKEYELKQRSKNPNDFYRYKREKAETKALVDDGVHDPKADLQELQQPKEALEQFPKATFGNGVNWVSALDDKNIIPRADRAGDKEQFVMDLNIPMEVPGTMNDVLFPHKAHTEWLACSNCHTGIFQMQRGANPITMKKINNGEYCGVCHGKVAFPIADCNRCHSVSKQVKNSAK